MGYRGVISESQGRGTDICRTAPPSSPHLLECEVNWHCIKVKLATTETVSSCFDIEYVMILKKRYVSWNLPLILGTLGHINANYQETDHFSDLANDPIFNMFQNHLQRLNTMKNKNDKTPSEILWFLKCIDFII